MYASLEHLFKKAINKNRLSQKSDILGYSSLGKQIISNN